MAINHAIDHSCERSPVREAGFHAVANNSLGMGNPEPINHAFAIDANSGGAADSPNFRDTAGAGRDEQDALVIG